MEQVKKIKNTLIITLVLIIITLILIINLEIKSTSFCNKYVDKMPFDSCMNLRMDSAEYTNIIFFITLIFIIILFVKILSYWIIKLINKLWWSK